MRISQVVFVKKRLKTNYYYHYYDYYYYDYSEKNHLVCRVSVGWWLDSPGTRCEMCVKMCVRLCDCVSRRVSVGWWLDSPGTRCEPSDFRILLSLLLL